MKIPWRTEHARIDQAFFMLSGFDGRVIRIEAGAPLDPMDYSYYGHKAKAWCFESEFYTAVAGLEIEKDEPKPEFLLSMRCWQGTAADLDGSRGPLNAFRLHALCNHRLCECQCHKAIPDEDLHGVAI